MVENKKNRSRIVFEGIQYHVLNMYLKCIFGPHAYFESGPKVCIWTIWKWTKTWISNVKDYSFPEFMMLDRRFGPLSNCPNGYFWSRFKVKLWTKRTFAMQIQHVIPLEILEFQYWIYWNIGPKIGPFRIRRNLVHSLLRAYQCISDYFGRF